jgi:hypothetical protein
MKWLIEAQIDQMANGGTIVDERAGDLIYNTVAPYLLKAVTPCLPQHRNRA